MILIWYLCREKITLKIRSANNVMSFRFHVALFYLYYVHCHWHVLCKLICFFVSLLHLQDSLERSRCPTPSVFPYTHSSSPPLPPPVSPRSWYGVHMDLRSSVSQAVPQSGLGPQSGQKNNLANPTGSHWNSPIHMLTSWGTFIGL